MISNDRLGIWIPSLDRQTCCLRCLQEAQRQTDDTFQQFMADSLQANWQRAKRRLLDSMLPSGGQGGIAQSMASNALSQPGSQTQRRKGGSCGSAGLEHCK